MQWTSHATEDKHEPQIEVRSNASGLTTPLTAMTSNSIVETLDVIEDF